MQVQDRYEKTFTISQNQVIAFAEISGDANPIHINADFAAQTPFKKPIIHGILGGSIFSTIFGMEFPGNGSIYLKQSFEFLRPMFAGQAYRAEVELIEKDIVKNKGTFSCRIIDSETNKVCIIGEATLLNKHVFV